MTTNENPLANKLMEVFSQIKRIHMKQSPVEGLTPGEVMLLIRIGKLAQPEEQGVKISDLSSSMRVAPPSVTQLINNLEEGGYVERSMDRLDRRAVRVKLKEKGEEVVGKATAIFSTSINGLIEFLGEEKSKEFIEIMEKVYIYFRKMNEPDSNSETDRRG